MNAECIALYGSQRVELKYVERLISNMRHSMLIGAVSFALVNFPIQLLSEPGNTLLPYDVTALDASFRCTQRNVHIHYAFCDLLLHSKITKFGTGADLLG